MKIDAASFSAPAVTGTGLQIWGGVECTVNRVQDRYFNQMQRSGHLMRASDIELFAGLGIRTIRYPVLWEQFAPDGFDDIDWSWADERLGRLRELGIRPIVGLVHHGSGPRYTSLIDPDFATGLARFARLVAERYPWIDMYTPVNEPLTTARFSALYGVWYPHARSDQAFVQALRNQCRAIVLAMRAIREVNPAAQLVQTEDLGRVFGTEALAAQVEFENERRWLSFDLLTGRIQPGHPMWQELRNWGLTKAQILEFQENPCPPDLIGINHYLTSDRYLDDDVDNYPDLGRGYRGSQPYVDVEAVRACVDCELGFGPRLLEAWQRYRRPLAITECHLACTREEQVRWLHQAWQASLRLRREGVDVRGVTAWSLLGAFDWNQLVSCDNGFYEPGVFDVRSRSPRPTALARLVRTLACHEEPQLPVLDQPGWWQREDRFFYPAAQGRSYAASAGPGSDMQDRSTRPLAIVGVTGTLGRAFARLCDVRGIPYHALSRAEVDVTDPKSVDAALETFRPWAVVNCAGYVRVDDAEREPELCRLANVIGPAVLAASCARHGARLVTFSSDLVFDGSKGAAYVETDAVAPLGVYGRTKAEMEARVLNILPSSLAIRTSAFFGPWDEYNFATIALRMLSAGEEFIAAEDAVVSPTYVLDLVHTTLDLLIDGESGIWHLANQGAVSWADFARQIAEAAGVSTERIVSAPMRSMQLAAGRPLHSALTSERGLLMPALSDAVSRYVRHRALALADRAPDGSERRRRFRPWQYRHTEVWL